MGRKCGHNLHFNTIQKRWYNRDGVRLRDSRREIVGEVSNTGRREHSCQ
jgi:hypothetical protein